MSQPSVASFFHSRKRSAIDDIFTAKSKLSAIESPKHYISDADNNEVAPVAAAAAPATRSGRRTPTVATTAAATRPRRCLKATTEGSRKASASSSSATSNQSNASQPKIVKFTLAGHLSPKKRLRQQQTGGDAAEPTVVQPTAGGVGRGDFTNVAMALFGNKEQQANVEQRGQRTPTKAEQETRLATERLAAARSKLSMEEIKERVTRSSRLAEMKESMGKLKALQEQRERIISTRKATMKTADKHNNADAQTDRAAKILGKGLKQFDTIELEILASPQKGLSTPTKQQTVPASPGGGTTTDPNALMSPKKTVTPRRLLFSPSKTASACGSPTKCGGGSPSASLPAYQRYQALRDAGRPTLTLPYKYRCLAETFKCVDTVCSMFFNRHESITMKKLRPAVQRLSRKNFTELELGQIMRVYPDAYKLHQKKMLNAGSHTKYDYYQLVVVPNVPNVLGGSTQSTSTSTISHDDDDNRNIVRAGQQLCMNPQVIIDRQQRFNQLLLDMVKEEHDRFLKQMDQPFVVPKDKITRWHLQFDLESCPDVVPAALPQPPNVEKFSSARDILSTARNLFNCATPSERLMQRVEEKLAEREKLRGGEKEAPTKTMGGGVANGCETDTETDSPTPMSRTGQTTTGPNAANNPVSALLKGVPQSLLERIRAKQAAKALDAMTRRPSQDKEAIKYERLPDLARHLRNIFVTESRNVLKHEIVLDKLENSFRERLAKDKMKELLDLIAAEVPNQWLTFPHFADVLYVKIKKDVPLGEVVALLERRAAEMA